MSSTEVAPTEVEKPLTEKKGHRWLPYLTLVLLAEVWLFMRLLPCDPLLIQRFQAIREARRQAQEEQRRNELMRNDPRVGVKVSDLAPESVTVVTREGQRKMPLRAENQATILVFIGYCTSCMASELSKWAELRSKAQDIKMVIVSRSSAEQVADFLEGTKQNLPIVSDPEGRLAKAFNAVWVPRVYGLDRQERIVWIQRKNSVDPQAVVHTVSTQKEVSDK